MAGGCPARSALFNSCELRLNLADAGKLKAVWRSIEQVTAKEAPPVNGILEIGVACRLHFVTVRYIDGCVAVSDLGVDTQNIMIWGAYLIGCYLLSFHFYHNIYKHGLALSGLDDVLQ
jgi:hypothetical protein